MTIYFDLSAAVHRRAGLGRYAESLARALVPLLGDRLGFFYNAEEGIQPVVGLEGFPTRTVSLGYKPWRMARLAGTAGARRPSTGCCPAPSCFTRPSIC